MKKTILILTAILFGISFTSCYTLKTNYSGIALSSDKFTRSRLGEVSDSLILNDNIEIYSLRYYHNAPRIGHETSFKMGKRQFFLLFSKDWKMVLLEERGIRDKYPEDILALFLKELKKQNISSEDIIIERYTGTDPIR